MKKQPNPNIPNITKPLVNKWLKIWNNNPEYTVPEKAMDDYFGSHQGNTDLTTVLVKCTLVNYFYSTVIYKIFHVAKHICDLKIDERLENNDLTLVSDIARITLKDKEGNDKNKDFYSFASKFCSRHKPDVYPIYDSYVVKVLKYYRDIGDFKAKFTDGDLKDYSKFKGVIVKFQEQYKLEKYTIKQLDMFLWQFGKEYFPNPEKKKDTEDKTVSS